MKWNVILRTDSKGDLGVYNVFDDTAFRLAVEEIFAKKLERKKFLEALDREAYFHYGDKVEWETLLTTWPPYIDENELDRLIAEFHTNRQPSEPLPERIYVTPDKKIKIDVYQQLRANWQRFSDYVWREGQLWQKN